MTVSRFFSVAASRVDVAVLLGQRVADPPAAGTGLAHCHKLLAERQLPEKSKQGSSKITSLVTPGYNDNSLCPALRAFLATSNNA